MSGYTHSQTYQQTPDSATHFYLIRRPRSWVTPQWHFWTFLVPPECTLGRIQYLWLRVPYWTRVSNERPPQALKGPNAVCDHPSRLTPPALLQTKRKSHESTRFTLKQMAIILIIHSTWLKTFTLDNTTSMKPSSKHTHYLNITVSSDTQIPKTHWNIRRHT